MSITCEASVDAFVCISRQALALQNLSHSKIRPEPVRQVGSCGGDCDWLRQSFRWRHVANDVRFCLRDTRGDMNTMVTIVLNGGSMNKACAADRATDNCLQAS